MFDSTKQCVTDKYNRHEIKKMNTFLVNLAPISAGISHSMPNDGGDDNDRISLCKINPNSLFIFALKKKNVLENEHKKSGQEYRFYDCSQIPLLILPPLRSFYFYRIALLFMVWMYVKEKKNH